MCALYLPIFATLETKTEEFKNILLIHLKIIVISPSYVNITFFDKK